MTLPDRKTILVVEDEATIRLAQTKALSDRGYTVIGVGSGRAAIDAVESDPTIDLILMDINLGKGMDGTEAAEIILRNRDIPLIFLTSRTEKEIVEKTERITSYGYIVKGSDHTVLEASIKMAFKLHEAYRSLQEKEKALRTSERRLLKAQSVSQTGSWELNVNERTLFASEEAFRIYGIEPVTRLLPLTVAQACVLPKYRGTLDEALRRLVAGEEEYDQEFEIRRMNDGEIRFIHSKAEAIMGEDGSTPLVVGVMRDITEHNRAEEALRESKAQLDLALQSAEMGVWYWDIVENMRHYDDQTCRLLGLDPATSSTTPEGFLKVLHPGDVEKVQEALRRTLKSNVPFEAGYRAIWPDGSIHHFNSRGRLIHDENGAPSRLIGTLWDMTEQMQAEEELTLSRLKLAEALDLAQVVYWEIDPESSEFIFNDALYSLYGTTAEREGGYRMPLEEYVSRFVHPDDLPTYRRQAELRRMDTGPVFRGSFEHRIIRRDGKVRSIVVMRHVVKDAEGRTVRFFGANQDITEQKRVDEALYRSQEQYRRLFETANEGIVTVDEHFTITLANNRFAEMVGWKQEDVIGKSLSTFTFEEDLPALEEGRKRRSEGVSEEFDRRFRRKDGSTVWFHASISPIMDNSGNFVGAFAMLTDITARREAEEKVRRQAEFLQLLINAMPYPVFYKDRDGRYLSCNSAFERFYGISRDRIAGKTVYEIASKDMADTYYRADAELLAHPGTQKYEGQVRSSDGVEHDVIFHKATYEGPDGDIAGMVGAIVDITDQKNAEKEKKHLEDQLRQAQKMEAIGTLAGGVAHDFNNMLSIILGYSELALEAVDKDSPLFSSLTEITRAAGRSADITRQLLAFARKQTISPKTLNLNETIEGLLKMLRRLIGENIDLLWAPKAGLWPVKMDPSQIDQILANLVVNARDAISDTGKISVETKNASLDDEYCVTHVDFTPGDFVLLSVSDDGCGMGKETMDKIFEPFFTTKKFGEGTGLGLAMIYGIVKQNDGFIDVYSEPGTGTTFRIYLPRQGKTVAEDERSPRIGIVYGHGETVLVVEDEASILALAERFLATLGYTTLAADNPEKALAVAGAHPGSIHLLMTDVVMPGMNGKDLSEELKKMRPELKCLFMSGYTPNAIVHKGILDTGVSFIQKPFSLRDLAATVKGALEQEE
jgi:PAS domain S-box-containing protein